MFNAPRTSTPSVPDEKPDAEMAQEEDEHDDTWDGVVTRNNVTPEPLPTSQEEMFEMSYKFTDDADDAAFSV